MKNAIAYYRQASTEDGETGINEQRDAVIEFANGHELRITMEFIDNGISGLTANRPGLTDLISHIEDDTNGEIDAVVVRDIARIGRSPDQINDFLGIMKAAKKDLLLANDQNAEYLPR